MRKYFVLLLIVFGGVMTTTVFAQGSATPSNSSLKVRIGLPNSATNKPFKELMQGLAAVSAGYQYTFDNSLALGVGIRYNYFSINEFKNNSNLNGGVHMPGVYLKVGQEKYYGKFGLDYGVRFGYSFNYFVSNKNKAEYGHPYDNQSFLITPTISFALKASETSTFNLFLGYTFQSFKFRPNQVGLDHFSGFGDEDMGSITTLFTIGFGYSYFFGLK